MLKWLQPWSRKQTHFCFCPPGGGAGPYLQGRFCPGDSRRDRDGSGNPHQSAAGTERCWLRPGSGFLGLGPQKPALVSCRWPVESLGSHAPRSTSAKPAPAPSPTPCPPLRPTAPTPTAWRSRQSPGPAALCSVLLQRNNSCVGLLRTPARFCTSGWSPSGRRTPKDPGRAGCGWAPSRTPSFCFCFRVVTVLLLSSQIFTAHMEKVSLSATGFFR